MKEKQGSGRGLMVRIRVLRVASSGFLSSSKVSLITREQTPQPRPGNMGSIKRRKKK